MISNSGLRRLGRKVAKAVRLSLCGAGAMSPTTLFAAATLWSIGQPDNSSREFSDAGKPVKNPKFHYELPVGWVDPAKDMLHAMETISLELDR